ncbi:type II secretion system F family protein [Fructobacillus sp. M158]|uniref:type II secretion system F family protein n=1 Tax=Fructobacillus parabroussonetiae TaxID=2713174 RepID=UPI00200AF9FB|nr:type II secretion system F family protein [Fructobacillus parabroussonetiae]MCK8617819.1 type II secretion system F family protein [Fructobacillus parabroussonetiae]
MFLKKKGLGLKRNEQALFLSELAELIQAGYPLGQALDVLAAGQGQWKEAIGRVQAVLSTGGDLRQAFHEILSDGLNGYLSLAEAHGRFDQALIQLATKVQQINRYQRELKQAMTYPFALVALLFLMSFGLEKLLYPVFQQLIAESDSNSPDNWSLIALHSLFGCLLLLALVILLGYWQLKRQRPMKRLLLLTKMPFLAPATKYLTTAILAEQLSVFLAAGLRLPTIIAYYSEDQSDKESFGYELALLAKSHLEAGGDFATFLKELVFLQPSLAAYLTRGFDEVTLSKYLAYYAKV